MTATLRPDAAAISEAIATLAQLELLFAQAAFGKKFRCAIPSFAPPGEPRLKLLRARHPLLQDVLARGESKVTPMSLTLEHDSRVLVISGPNAGGKTIVLKTLGLFSLMAQAGLPLPADEAVLPWFDEVLADIGDAQSITESLSTFSAHVRQITRMIERAGEHSLVLLDELGAATDPEEGGALGVAAVDHFRSLGAFAAVSTHLPALKTYAATTAGVQNASMGFDAETLSPNYKLAVGVPGQSAGLAMAQRLGIPAPIVERARQVLGSQAQQAATFLQHLQEQVEELEAERKNLRAAEQQLRERERELAQQWERLTSARLRELDQRVSKLIAQFEENAKTVLEKLGESTEERRAAKQAQRGVAKQQREFREGVRQAASEALGQTDTALRAPPPVLALAAGATVRLAGLGVKGRVLRQLAGDDWEVEVGRLKMRVAAEDVAEVLPAGEPPAGRLPSRVTFQAETRPRGAASEINVIGKTSDEARDAVDKFLDDAVLAEIERVRIIHGHGFQVLRKALWQMFTNHPHVAKYYQAEQHEGGSGATIVEVKL